MGRFGNVLRAMALGVVAVGSVAQAGEGGGEQMIEDFSCTPDARWEFISDQVMGGVSTGTVALEREGPQGPARVCAPHWRCQHEKQRRLYTIACECFICKF